MNPTDKKPVGLVVCVPAQAVPATDEDLQRISDGLYGFPNVIETGTDEIALIQRIQALDYNALPFDPKYVFSATPDMHWYNVHLTKAVGILEAHPQVCVVVGLFSIAAPYQPPAAITAKPHSFIYPMRYECGQLIELDAWCFSWAVMRREVLSFIEPSENNIRSIIAIRKAGFKAVTERTLLIGRIDPATQLVYYPESPGAALSQAA